MTSAITSGTSGAIRWFFALLSTSFPALAKASSLAGAVAAGAYAGLLGFLLRLHVEASHVEALTAGLAVLAGLGLVAAALALERTCRVRQPPEPPAEAR